VIQLNEEKQAFETCLSFKHQFPASKILWIPDTVPSSFQSALIFVQKQTGSRPDIVATSSDKIRLFEIGDNKEIKQEVSLEMVKHPKKNPP
jgi:hypothetical protein